MEQGSKNRKFLVPCILLAALAVFVTIAYATGVFYYKEHFFANTIINNVSADGLDADTMVQNLQSEYDSYTLEVCGREGEVLQTLRADEIDLTIVIADEVDSLLEEQDEYSWFLQWTSQHELKCSYEITYDENKAREVIQSWPILDENNMEAPQDAYLSEYSSEIKGYEIIPETAGTVLDAERAEALILEGLDELASQVSLADCYTSAAVTSADAALIARRDALNKLTGARICYDWNGREVIVDGDLIHEWIVEDGENITVDEEKVAEFVKEQASAYDTFGKKKEFTTATGETLTLDSAYGWRTDRAAESQELLALILEGSQADREPVYSIQGYVKGEDDIGGSYVEIDLSNQHLYLWIEGEVVLETDFVSGNVSAGNTTPPGIFGLTYKTRDAVLRGADYATPVKYWMPFNGNIGMHDASWRRSFGGDIFMTSGSHGCINLPSSKASEIYGYMEKGFPVVCYYYDGIPTVPVNVAGEVPDETVVAVEGEAVAAESQEQPAGGESQPAEGEAQPAGGDMPPAEEMPQPAESDGQPAENAVPDAVLQPAENTGPAAEDGAMVQEQPADTTPTA